MGRQKWIKINSHYLTALFIITALALIVYSNSFYGSFHFDDYDNIVNNSKIQNINDVESWWSFSANRPISMFTFVVNYHFSQLDVFYYHLENVIIHIFNGFLLFYFSILIFSSPTVSNYKISAYKEQIALIIAIIFVVHPLATQSVTYIIQRQNALASMFYLSALVLYMTGRLKTTNTYAKIAIFAFAAISSILAILSKENAYTIPLIIVLLEIFFLFSPSRKEKINKKIYLLLLIPLLGITAIALSKFSFEVFKPIVPDQSMGYPEVVSPLNYLFTQFAAIPKYIQLLILPINQNLDPDFTMSKSFWEINTLAGFSFIIGTIALGIYLFNKNRIISFGIFWFYITIAIEASIIPLPDLFFEHRTYLPSFGIILIFTTALFQILSHKSKTLTYIFFATIIIILSTLTYQRNKVWKNEISLWTDVVSKSPNKARPNANLGMAYNLEKNWSKAIEYYTKSIKISDIYSIVFYNRANAYSEILDLENAISDYTSAIKISPDYVSAYYNRGLTFSKQQKYNEAIANYTKTLELDPEFSSAYYNRGLDYLMLNQFDNAISDLSQAIILDPNLIVAYVNRGVAYLNKENYKLAIEDFNKAESLNPEMDMIYFNRAVAYHNLGNLDQAILDYSRTIEFNPGYTMAYFYRGNIYFEMKDWTNALNDYENVLILEPSFNAAQENIQKIKIMNGQM
jgi:tetratricopeptide (TPR) repeat protein